MNDVPASPENEMPAPAPEPIPVVVPLPPEPLPAPPPPPVSNPVKRAIVLDLEEDCLGVEYDNGIGSRNTMRLEASNYEDAVNEIKQFLGIEEDRDADGAIWEID